VYSRQEVVGRNCRFLQGPGTDAVALQHLATALHEVRPDRLPACLPAA
jgi:hypothetical protein